ncbi:MAG: flippase [Candidatus Kerfeldbacteria bacterium]|nr:flippase [Candidatus Kerfeldbacteria bacterium]
MSSEPGVLARNTSYFTFALVAQKVISFLYFTFLARLFGPEQMGKYVFALSLTTIFSVFLDVGLATVLTREVAREPAVAERYVRLIFGFKVLASWLVVAAVAATVNLLGYPELTRQLVYLACLVMVLDSFILSAYSAIRGFHTLLWESLGTILVQVILAVAGVLVSLLTHDLRAFMAALALAVSVHFIYALWQLKGRFGVQLKPLFNWPGWRSLLVLTWPFALGAILTRAYGYVDTVLLSFLAGDRAVGLYSIAYKITFALQFIPTAFAASLLPGFSSYFVADKAKLAQVFSRSVVYLTAIAMPVSLGIMTLAPEIIRSIYPAYVESIVPLQILIGSLIFLFATFPVGSLLPACNRQGRHTLNIGLAAACDVALNLVLIPRYGPWGAALASFISTAVLLALGWSVARHLVQYDGRDLSLRLLKIFFSGLVMAALAWQLKSFVHFTAVIPLAGVVYLTLLIGLGGVSWSELKLLWQIVIRRKGMGEAV